MGLLRHFKNTINAKLGILNVENERNKIGLYILTDERDKLVDTFRISTNNFKTVHLYVNAKQRCTVQDIETVTDQQLYNVHAHDKNGKQRKFKMERLC